MKKIYIIILLSLIVLWPLHRGSADTVNTGNNSGTVNTGESVSTPPQSASFLQNPLKAKSVEQVLTTVVDLAIFIGVIFAVLMFIWIGFKFILARGNQTALKEAREWFLWAVIGTAVLISAKVIVEVVKNTFISAGVVNQDLFKKP
ncbi:MAG: pilin [bacterium]|nr:pilin [bacterium]